MLYEKKFETYCKSTFNLKVFSIKKLIFINVEQPKFVMFIKSEDGSVFYRTFNGSYIEKLI